MDSFFSSSTLFNIVLAVIWFISGIRDFQGKDPLIKLPFNQYVRDPEYRAFWQKKNGVFYMLNALAFLILAFTPVTSLVYRILFGVAIGGDLLYLVAYESWNHSADCIALLWFHSKIFLAPSAVLCYNGEKTQEDFSYGQACYSVAAQG